MEREQLPVSVQAEAGKHRSRRRNVPPDHKIRFSWSGGSSVFCQIEVVQNGVPIQSEKAAGFSPVERKGPPPLLFGFYPIRAWVRLYDSPSNLIILP